MPSPRCYHVSLSQNPWGYEQALHDAAEVQNFVNPEGSNSLYEAEKSDSFEILE